jgi:hypothetical protein
MPPIASAATVSSRALPPSRHPTEATRGWFQPWHALVSVVAVVLHVVFRGEGQTALAGIYAGLNAALALLVGFRYITLPRTRLPWIELVLALHYSLHGIAITAPPIPVGNSGIVPSVESYEMASLVGLLASITLVLGFAGTFTTFQSIRTDRLMPRLSPQIIVAAGRVHLWMSVVYLSVLVFAPSTIAKLGPLRNIVDGLVGRVAMMLVATTALAVQPTAATRGRVVIATLVVCANSLATSMLGELVLPMVSAGLVWHTIRRKIPWLPVGLALAAMLVLQPVKGYYRAVRWQESADLSVIDGWQQAFDMAYSGSSEEPSGAQATQRRFDELSALAYVIETVPRLVSHTDGATYALIPASLVPRLFWPDKPDMTKYGLDVFAIALGLNTEEGAQYSTTGITITTHGYYEHGIMGSVLWMMALGVLYAIAATIFRGSLNDLSGAIWALVGLTWSIGAGLISFVGSYWQAIAGGILLPWFTWMLGRVFVTSERA